MQIGTKAGGRQQAAGSWERECDKIEQQRNETIIIIIMLWQAQLQNNYRQKAKKDVTNKKTK